MSLNWPPFGQLLLLVEADQQAAQRCPHGLSTVTREKEAHKMRRRNMSLTAVLTVVVMLFVLPILLSGCGGGGGGTGTPNGGPVYNPTLTESSGDTLTGINSPTPTTSPSPPVGSLQLALERQATRSVAPEDKIPPETKFLRCTLTGTANYGPGTVAYENPATLSGVPAGTFTLKVEFLVNETDTTAIGSFTTTATITQFSRCQQVYRCRPDALPRQEG